MVDKGIFVITRPFTTLDNAMDSDSVFFCIGMGCPQHSIFVYIQEVVDKIQTEYTEKRL